MIRKILLIPGEIAMRDLIREAASAVALFGASMVLLWGLFVL